MKRAIDLTLSSLPHPTLKTQQNMQTVRFDERAQSTIRQESDFVDLTGEDEAESDDVLKREDMAGPSIGSIG